MIIIDKIHRAVYIGIQPHIYPCVQLLDPEASVNIRHQIVNAIRIHWFAAAGARRIDRIIVDDRVLHGCNSEYEKILLLGRTCIEILEAGIMAIRLL